MKVIKEEFKNFPDKATVVLTGVEGQAIDDTLHGDKEAEAAEKEIEKNAKGFTTGAPKQPEPEPAKIPHVKIDENLFEEVVKKTLTEDVNEDNAARIVQSVIRNSFGIDVDVESYKDSDRSKAVIIQFIVSKAENDKMVYDEFKEKLYRRFNNQVNISCKTFSSPNLEENHTEYKIKVLVIKERSDKYGSASKANAKYNSADRHNENESLVEATQASEPYIDVVIPEELIELSGMAAILGAKDKKTDTADTKPKKAAKALSKYLFDNYDIKADPADIRHYQLKTDHDSTNPNIFSWELRATGDPEDLQDFMDANNILGEVKYSDPNRWNRMDAADVDAKGKKKKEDLTLFDMLWNELSADLKAEVSDRYLPAIKDDVETRNKKPPMYPNTLRYKSDDSNSAVTNQGSDVELRVSGDNIKVAPKNGDLRFAQVVANTYADYGVKFVPDASGKSGTIVIPPEYQGKDISADKKANTKMYHDKGTTTLDAFTDDELYPAEYSREEIGDLRASDEKKSRKQNK